jgi:hypothetical protein
VFPIPRHFWFIFGDFGWSGIQCDIRKGAGKQNINLHGGMNAGQTPNFVFVTCAQRQIGETAPDRPTLG